MAVDASQIPTLDNTLGAVFLGVMVSGMLFGSTTQQVYYYYHYYPYDSLLHKTSVCVLWLLDALHMSLSISAAYHYGVRGFGDLFGLRQVIWSVKLLIAVNVLVVLIVQGLYAYRVWRLSGFHNGILRYLVAAVVLGGFAIGIVTAVETYSLENFEDVTTISWAIEGSLAASTTIDCLNAAAMCYYLRKSKGLGRALNSRISTLMQYTLSCGVFTSACSISTLVTFILMPNNLIFLALTFLLTRLYVNSFMAMMNARPRRNQTDHLSAEYAPSEGAATQSMGLPYSFTGHGTVAQGSMGDIESQQERQPRPTANMPMAMYDRESSIKQMQMHNWSATATVPAAARTFDHVYGRQW
ncbi:hypothetical protein C8F01DRAFT_501821 [Mycena amicta]|nr:hypothetical protein C8F01DRAFT_501821 [Mycena amicta]